MKVKVERDEPKFTPIKIEIVIESQDERNALVLLAKLDTTLPDIVKSRISSFTDEHRLIMMEMLASIHEKLTAGRKS